ncbi:MAG TPA: YlbF family regulator [Clostridia bacterium]|nr:YlbF family regulator [Clostridia bacterium]
MKAALRCKNMSINDILPKLVEAIKSSPEFTGLKQAKSTISKMPDLKRELEEFNLGQKQLYSGKLTNKEAESRAVQLNTKFKDLSRIPEVNKYMNAAKNFDQLMIRIYNDINETLEKSL